MQKNSLVLIGIVGVVAVVAVMMMMGQKPDSTTNIRMAEEASPSPTTGDAMMEDKTSDSMMEDKDEVADDDTMMEQKMVEVEAGAYYFAPKTITVKKGESVKIVMNSVDMMHDFVIDELDVKMPIVKSGDTGTVEFVADQVGTFEYYCSVGDHKSKGQVGTLIVEE